MAEKKYIELQKALNVCEMHYEHCLEMHDWSGDATADNIKRDIETIPTADVAEVKHGYWKDRYGNKYANHLYECSVCGKKPLYEFYTNELRQIKTRQALTPACPYCFAKMDVTDTNVGK